MTNLISFVLTTQVNNICVDEVDKLQMAGYFIPGNGTIIIFIIIIVAVVFLIRLFKYRCPRCGEFSALEETDRTYLGASSSDYVNGRKVYNNRYRITYKCTRCGAVMTRDEVERG